MINLKVTHLISDFYGVEESYLSSAEDNKQLIEDTAKKAGLTVLQTCIKQFEPRGYSLLLFLSESHLSIHTWPEYQALIMDINTCGAVEVAFKAQTVFKKLFMPSVIHEQRINRGKLSAQEAYEAKIYDDRGEVYERKKTDIVITRERSKRRAPEAQV